MPLIDVGQVAPDFDLKDQFGKSHRLKDYRGRIVVLQLGRAEQVGAHDASLGPHSGPPIRRRGDGAAARRALQFCRHGRPAWRQPFWWPRWAFASASPSKPPRML